jgi:hypothetical protein
VRSVAPGYSAPAAAHDDVILMKSSAIARLLRLAGWAIPILAVLWCAPSVARADCGDYVVTRLAHPDQGMMPGKQHSADLPAPAKPHKPCNGPHCSRAPAVPVAPVPTVTPPTAQEWGWFADDLGFTAPGRGAWLFDTCPQHPIRFASSIFHPPRLAA